LQRAANDMMNDRIVCRQWLTDTAYEWV
jgi:hypothetical protein